MNITCKTYFATFALGLGLLLGGCATTEPTVGSYDLGSLDRAPQSSLQTRLQALTLPAISLAEVNTPAWLDSHHMMYRLGYSNDQQTRAYAASRWVTTPGELFQQRLTARLSHAGGAVVPAADGALGLPVLRITLDDFSQIFTSAGQSHGHVALRAALFDGHRLLAQKMFDKKMSSSSADAQGGALALSQASDAVIDEIAVWLSSQPKKK